MINKQELWTIIEDYRSAKENEQSDKRKMLDIALDEYLSPAVYYKIKELIVKIYLETPIESCGYILRFDEELSELFYGL